MWYGLGPTHDCSQRQLPTDKDHAGGPCGSIREYQTDQPSKLLLDRCLLCSMGGWMNILKKTAVPY